MNLLPPNLSMNAKFGSSVCTLQADLHPGPVYVYYARNLRFRCACYFPLSDDSTRVIINMPYAELQW